MEDAAVAATPRDGRRQTLSSPAKSEHEPEVSSPAKVGRKRGLSGSLIQKLNHLRGEHGRLASDADVQKNLMHVKSIDDDAPATSPISPQAELDDRRPALVQSRKSSLRKTAIMAGRKIVAEGRERRNSLSTKSLLGRLPLQQPRQVDVGPSKQEDKSTLNALRINLEEQRVLSETNSVPKVSMANVLGSPLEIASPTSYASTTDDDDASTTDVSSATKAPPARSYFPPIVTTHKPASPTHPPRSPLSHAVSNSSLYTPSGSIHLTRHDYSETEYWGWVILVVTWITFTVGMGSCLGIWSWAWDVGETPYAPPELEDDPTLPIVGYYPALMVLTGVVVWVWVTVAWVGMKYFRHAKIEV